MKSARAAGDVVDDAIGRYLAAWNARLASTRTRHLERAWSTTARFQDPLVDVNGRAAMDDYIAGFKASHPAARIAIPAHVERHHDAFHFAWTISAGDDELAGRSYGTLDRDGRIKRLVSFFESSPGDRWRDEAQAVIARARGARRTA